MHTNTLRETLLPAVIRKPTPEPMCIATLHGPLTCTPKTMPEPHLYGPATTIARLTCSTTYRIAPTPILYPAAGGRYVVRPGVAETSTNVLQLSSVPKQEYVPLPKVGGREVQLYTTAWWTYRSWLGP